MASKVGWVSIPHSVLHHDTAALALLQSCVCIRSLVYHHDEKTYSAFIEHDNMPAVKKSKDAPWYNVNVDRDAAGRCHFSFLKFESNKIQVPDQPAIITQ